MTVPVRLVLTSYYNTRLIVSIDNHVALVNLTIIEPGIYLLSTCALSFRPLFRIVAKVLHLQAFITHTKSTLQPGKSYSAKKSTTTTHTDIHLHHLHFAGTGKFHRLSEDSDSSGRSKRMEVLITTTVDIETEPETGVKVRSKDEFAKDTGTIV
jgi:hypothetical protein